MREKKLVRDITALNRWENHNHRWNYLSSIAAFQNFQHDVVQWYFAARRVCFIAHNEHGMRQIHVRPFKALKLPSRNPVFSERTIQSCQSWFGSFLAAFIKAFASLAVKKRSRAL